MVSDEDPALDQNVTYVVHFLEEWSRQAFLT